MRNVAIAAVLAVLVLKGTDAQTNHSSVCQAAVEAAVADGNCSAIACPASCARALTKIPLYCIWTAVDLSASEGNAASQLHEDLSACGVRKFFSNTTSERPAFDTGASTATLVKYLIGICLGAVLMSVVFIILLAAPMLLSHAVGAPTLLVSKGKKAAIQGTAALGRKKDELVGSDWAQAAQKKWHKAGWKGAPGDDKLPVTAAGGTMVPPGATAPAEELPPSAEAQVSASHAAALAKSVAGKVEGAAARYVRGAGEAADEAIRGLQRGLVDDGNGGGDELAAAPEGEEGKQQDGLQPAGTSGPLELVSTAHTSTARTRYIVWACLAFGLYIAAVTLLIIGVLQFVHNSVAAYSLTSSNKDGALVAIEWLIISLLILTGVCDLFAWYVVMASNMQEFKLRRWTIRNRLYSPWVMRHAYRIRVVVAGLVTLVLSIACILFGLGLVIVLLQLIAQLLCAEVDKIAINGTPVADLCITLPTSDEPFCGWGVLDVCYDVTSMGVLTLVLGAALLLWSHIIWFTLLLISMWQFMSWNVVVTNEDKNV